MPCNAWVYTYPLKYGYIALKCVVFFCVKCDKCCCVKHCMWFLKFVWFYVCDCLFILSHFQSEYIDGDAFNFPEKVCPLKKCALWKSVFKCKVYVTTWVSTCCCWCLLSVHQQGEDWMVVCWVLLCALPWMWCMSKLARWKWWG